MHNVRLTWLKVSAPDLLRGLDKIEKDDASDKKVLSSSTTKSAKAIRTLLAKAFASDGRVKNFKPHAAAFLAYLISHESHHRGQILLALKQSGHAVDKKFSMEFGSGVCAERLPLIHRDASRSFVALR